MQINHVCVGVLKEFIKEKVDELFVFLFSRFHCRAVRDGVASTMTTSVDLLMCFIRIRWCSVRVGSW